MVKYDEIDLQVFAFVNNRSSEICVSPKKSIELADEFGFTHVEITTKTVSDTKELKKELDIIYTDVFFNKNKVDSEGAVMYIGDKTDTVRQLIKLKTMDYRMKRKLREKIRSLLSPKSDYNLEKLIKKYKKELNSMCKDYKEQMEEEIKYYLEMGDYMLPLSLKLHRKNIHVTDRYVDFLVLTKPFFEMEFRNISFNSEDQFNLISFGFRNSKFLEEMRQIYSNKIMDENTLQNLKIKFDTNEYKNMTVSSPFKLLTFVPMGIIGSGKTFMMDSIIRKFAEEKNIWGGTISSDESAKITMKNMMENPHVKKVNVNDCEDVVFNKSHKERISNFDYETRQLFGDIESGLKKRLQKEENALKTALNLKKVKIGTSDESLSESPSMTSPVPYINEGEDSSADEDDSEDMIYRNKKIIYIDKNHPPNASFKYHLNKYEQYARDFDAVMVGMIPSRIEEFDITKWHYFDDKTLFICLHNVITRKDHPSLNVSESKRMNIFLLFLQFFNRNIYIEKMMKNCIKYPLNFDVYQKKHVSEIDLPGEENTSSKFERKYEKDDFKRFSELLMSLFTFKRQKDCSGKIKIVAKKIAFMEQFMTSMRKEPAYKEIIKMIRTSHIDYDSKKKEFASNVMMSLKRICQTDDYKLLHWAEEKRCFPLYVGFIVNIDKEMVNGVLKGLIKIYGKSFVKFSKDFNIFEKSKKKKKKDEQIIIKMMNYADSLHSTFYFFKNYLKEESEMIENFKEHIRTDLKITHFIYCLLYTSPSPRD